MPRLIKAERGNGIRPSDPRYVADEQRTDGHRQLLVVLDVSEDTHELVGTLHDAALDVNDDRAWPVLGQTLYLHNPRPVMPKGVEPREGVVEYQAALSTIHGAATEVIGAFEDQALDMPEWVASTAPELAEIVAEHFTVPGYSTCELVTVEQAQRRLLELRGEGWSGETPDGEPELSTEGDEV